MASKEAAINELLSCGVCLNRYTDPRSLPCHHSFCKKCIDGLLATYCPICRNPFHTSGSGAVSLPVAFEISNLLEIMSKKYQTETLLSGCTHQTAPRPHTPHFQVCEDHERPKDMYCDTCDEYVCCKCSLNFHHSHYCDRAEFLLAKHRQQIEASLEPMKNKIEELEHTLTLFDTREKEMKDQERTVQDDLIKVYQELANQLEESQRKLSEELSASTQRKLRRHAVERAQVETALVQMKSCHEFVSQELKTCSDYQIQAAKVEYIKQIRDAHSMVWVKTLQPTQPDTVLTPDKLRATLTQAFSSRQPKKKPFAHSAHKRVCAKISS